MAASGEASAGAALAYRLLLAFGDAAPPAPWYHAFAEAAGAIAARAPEVAHDAAKGSKKVRKRRRMKTVERSAAAAGDRAGGDVQVRPCYNVGHGQEPWGVALVARNHAILLCDVHAHEGLRKAAILKPV